MRKVFIALSLLLMATGTVRPVHAADNYLDCYRATTDNGEKGIEVCSRLIDTGKWKGLDLARLLSNRALAYIKVKDYDHALTDLKRALAISPDYVYAYDHLGEINRLRGHYDRAITEYDKAIRIDSQFLSAYLDRGLAYEAMGDLKSARADYQRVLDLPGKDRPIDKWAKGRARTFIDKLAARTRHGTTSGGGPSSEPTSEPPRPTPRSTTTAATPAPPLATSVTPPPATPKAVAPSPPSKLAAAPAQVVAPAAPSSMVAPAPVPPGQRVALVIGEGKYKSANELRNPPHDAADVAAALRRLGFVVIEGIDLDKQGMESKVRAFGRKLDQATLALFYYAGHGMQVGGKNYLIPIDAKLERASDLPFETIEVSQVLGLMEADQRVNLVFLDACRDNPLTRRFARSLGTSRSVEVGTGLASIRSAVGTMIIYATQPDNVALDGVGRNSPFTAALLKNIDTRGLEIESLMKRVRADVMKATHGRQVPWDHSSLIGDVVLAR
jgi:tetratricopeptide (TPR) repeat protein